MVKGVTRRVIVVKTPDKRLFEQAIFIVKEDAFTRDGVTAEQVLAEAQRVADGYVRRNSGLRKKLWHIPPPPTPPPGPWPPPRPGHWRYSCNTLL